MLFIHSSCLSIWFCKIINTPFLQPLGQKSSVLGPGSCIFCFLILYNDFQASGTLSAPVPPDPNLDNQTAAYLLAVDNFEEAMHSALNDGLGGHSAESSPLVDASSAGNGSFSLQPLFNSYVFLQDSKLNCSLLSASRPASYFCGSKCPVSISEPCCLSC